MLVHELTSYYVAGLETNGAPSSKGRLKMCLGQIEIFSWTPLGQKGLLFLYYYHLADDKLDQPSADYNPACLLCHYSHYQWQAAHLFPRYRFIYPLSQETAYLPLNRSV